VQYVVYNLLGSTLFLFALGTLYAVTGTLNMADLAERVADLPADETALIRVGAVLLLLVFAIKAAVLPLHFWLPSSYANAPMPVAALFAIMTKVGAYSILRMYTLVFGPDQEISDGLVGDWLLPAALLTLTAGTLGILGARKIGKLVAFSAIASMGTLLIAISLFTPAAAGAAIYYIIHSTFATGLMFLVADLIVSRRGGLITPSAPMPQNGLIAALFFAGGIALAGMPPLSGFIGKLLVMDSARDADQWVLIWAVILTASLVTVVGFARAGSLIFWKSYDDSVQVGEQGEAEHQASQQAEPQPTAKLPFVAVFGLLGGLVALSIFAGPVSQYANATAAQLFTPQAYIGAVLKKGGGQ